MHNIPDTVSQAELVEAMKPLLDLLGIRLEDMYGNIDINLFERKVTFVHTVPADAVEIKAIKPDAISSNVTSTYAAVTCVGIGDPPADMGRILADVRIEEGQV